MFPSTFFLHSAFTRQHAIGIAVLICLVSSISCREKKEIRPKCSSRLCSPKKLPCRIPPFDLCYLTDPKNCHHLHQVKDSKYFENNDCKTADGNIEGYYVRTLFGAIFISHKEMTRTWQEAVDECCERGGYLATFLDKNWDDLILQVALNRYGNSSFWTGAIDAASKENAVWCLPGSDHESIDSHLITLSLLETSVNMNCGVYKMSRKELQLDRCSKKLAFICKIEVMFPESCVNPYYKLAKSALQIKIIRNAIANEEEPGAPFYFKCNAKQYMAIIAQFQRVQAVRHCKERGLQLLSVETIAEMNCIFDFFNGIMSSSYWTSGINYGTANSTTYGWCSTGKLVDAKLWAEGEPMDPEGNRCVALTITEDNRLHSGLEAVYCAFLLPLICQIP